MLSSPIKDNKMSEDTRMASRGEPLRNKDLVVVNKSALEQMNDSKSQMEKAESASF